VTLSGARDTLGVRREHHPSGGLHQDHRRALPCPWPV